MFGNKKDSPSTAGNTNSPSPTGGTNSLVHGTNLEGVLHAGSDIRIDGQLNGKLFCKGRLILGETGVIDGEVECQDAIIEGKFTGKIKVTELLTVKETANISGDVSTGKLFVHAGALFNVSCDMGGQKIKNMSDSAKSA
jgi:cytoskeletal protein CcmA (bactofilin family)